MRQVLHCANSTQTQGIGWRLCHHKHNVKVDVDVNVDTNVTCEQGLKLESSIKHSSFNVILPWQQNLIVHKKRNV